MKKIITVFLPKHGVFEFVGFSLKIFMRVVNKILIADNVSWEKDVPSSVDVLG